jgi:hypothetical protein
MYQKSSLRTGVSLTLLLFSFISTMLMTNLVFAPEDPIINGGFETGDLTGWDGFDIAVTEGFGHSGTYSLVIIADGAVYQTFDPAVNLAGCDLTFWYYSADGITIFVVVSYTVGDSDSHSVAGTDTWQQATYPLDPARNVDQITFLTPETLPGLLSAIDDVAVVCEPAPNEPPVADAGGPYTGTVGSAVTLDGSGSSDPDGTIVAWEWDLDNDGEYDDATGETVEAIWGLEGVFVVGLRVTDDAQESDVDETTVTITTEPTLEPPTASFTEDLHIAPVDTLITFDPSGSSDPDGEIILYEWDWESDGVYDEAYETPEIVTHSYSTAGTYVVTLRVTDDDGFTDMASDEKTITPGKVIPEVPFGTILASAAMIIALVGFFAFPKLRRRTNIEL